MSPGGADFSLNQFSLVSPEGCILSLELCPVSESEESPGTSLGLGFARRVSIFRSNSSVESFVNVIGELSGMELSDQDVSIEWLDRIMMIVAVGRIACMWISDGSCAWREMVSYRDVYSGFTNNTRRKAERTVCDHAYFTKNAVDELWRFHKREFWWKHKTYCIPEPPQIWHLSRLKPTALFPLHRGVPYRYVYVDPCLCSVSRATKVLFLNTRTMLAKQSNLFRGDWFLMI